SGPNESTTRSNPSVPRATARRARSSASMTTAPRCARIAESVDFPAPIPPVSPTSSMVMWAGCGRKRLLGVTLATFEVLEDGLERNLVRSRRLRFGLHHGVFGDRLGLRRGLGLRGGCLDCGLDRRLGLDR